MDTPKAVPGVAGHCDRCGGGRPRKAEGRGEGEAMSTLLDSLG